MRRLKLNKLTIEVYKINSIEEMEENVSFNKSERHSEVLRGVLKSCILMSLF